MRKLMLMSVALLGVAGAASAQTAGGPANASPGAMPSDTPLTSNGTPRSNVTTGAATPATPAAIGANKPARPAAARTRRTTTHKATPPVSQ